MKSFTNFGSALSNLNWAPIVAALMLALNASLQTAFANHINFREKDMRTIVVGETRENEIFYGCKDKQAAIELSTWIDSAPWTMDKIMADGEGQAKFGGDKYCDEHSLAQIIVDELLYLADQKRGEDKVGRDEKVYFGTRYSSILLVTSSDREVYYMLANQRIEGEPTEQEDICRQVLQPVCP